MSLSTDRGRLYAWLPPLLLLVVLLILVLTGWLDGPKAPVAATLGGALATLWTAAMTNRLATRATKEAARGESYQALSLCATAYQGTVDRFESDRVRLEQAQHALDELKQRPDAGQAGWEQEVAIAGAVFTVTKDAFERSTQQRREAKDDLAPRIGEVVRLGPDVVARKARELQTQVGRNEDLTATLEELRSLMT